MNSKIIRKDFYAKYEEFLIFMKVSENCNMKCTFCYQVEKRPKVIDTEEKLALAIKNMQFGIDRFLKLRNVEDHEYARLSICFFGGECTLNPWAMKRITQYLIDTVPVNKGMRITWTSNGIIMNEEIKDVLTKMHEFNKTQGSNTTVMISSDNDKEVYDKNRKVVGTDKSGFEIVNENIIEYVKFLTELNFDINRPNRDIRVIEVASVLATAEQIESSREAVQDVYKGIYRRTGVLYDTQAQPDDYIEGARDFLERTYTNIINKCAVKSNRYNALSNVISTVFPLESSVRLAYGECHGLYTIDGDGEFNWCNKNKKFEGKENITNEELGNLTVFNDSKEADNEHFTCVKEKYQRGEVTKDMNSLALWKLFSSFYTMGENIRQCNIYSTDKEWIYHFVKYVICTSSKLAPEYPNSIYVKYLDDRVVSLCRDHDIVISATPVVSTYDNNVFHITENGEIFYDESVTSFPDLTLGNINDRFFMFLHLPSLIASLNKFYQAKLKNIQ